ncbi:hypothetical protein [Paraglaciecola sp. 2405UD69-4]|uniref:hypothetical protein n=1 Tax=Paraglaciecola sp. 2405UD69-4 TaxID=3391836 RepID=UPI0039C95D60
MNKKPKFLLYPASTLLIGAIAVALTSYANTSSYDGRSFADCAENLVFDQSLPISHPVNRCATQKSQGVSWSSWFTGHSSSYQFHFIDLLELLSRSGDTSEGTTP